MNPLLAQRSIRELEAGVAVGQSFAGRKEFQQAVLALFVRRGEGIRFKKWRSDTGRAEVGCAQKKCLFRVGAKLRGNVWVVTSSEVVHTCEDKPEEEGGNRRKRGLYQDDVKELVPQVEALATVRGNAAAAVQNMVSGSTGLQLKRTQAGEIARANREDPIAVALNEVCFIKAYVEKLAALDEDGTYMFRDSLEAAGRTFVFTYLATSAAKEFWRHSERHVVAIDATFLTGPLQGTFFVAVSKDANNNQVVLAFGHYQKENYEMWSSFIGQLKRDFPNIKVILSDAQKGIEACQNMYPPVRFSRCAKHLLENAKKNDLGPITEDFQVQFWVMTKAATAEAYNDAYARAAQINKKAADWINERKEQFAEHVFAQEGIKRFGETTSNLAEQFFSVFESKGWKDEPMIRLTQAVLVRESQRFHMALNQVNNLGETANNLTPWVEKELREAYFKANKVQLRVVVLAPHEFVGLYDVKNANPMRVLEVKLRQWQHDGKWVGHAECACGVFRALGRPCKHVLAALRIANARFADWNYLDSRWVHSVFHLSTWRRQHMQRHFPKTALLFTDNDRMELLPPPIPKKGGKKKAKKSKVPKEAVPGQQKKRVVVCTACGKEGHLFKTCTSPDAAKIAEAYKTKRIPLMPNFEDDVLDGGAVAGDAEVPQARVVAPPLAHTEAIVRAVAQATAGNGKKVKRIVIDLV